MAAVTFQRLDTPQRKHHTPCAITCRSTQRQHFQYIEAGDNLTGGYQLYVLRQTIGFQRGRNKSQGVVQWHAQVVCKLERSCTCSTFRAVNRNKVGHDTGNAHGIAYVQEFLFVADTYLKPDRLTAG